MLVAYGKKHSHSMSVCFVESSNTALVIGSFNLQHCFT